MDDIERIRAMLLHRDRVPFVARQHFQQDIGYEQLFNNRDRGRIYRYQGPPPPRGPGPGARGEPRFQRIKVEDDVLG